LATADLLVASQIRRSLLALFEADGIAVGAPGNNGPPRLFFSGGFFIGRGLADREIVDEIRALTSAALFAQSSVRRGAPLADTELESLVRNELRASTNVRLRARYRSLAIDASVEKRDGNGTQVTNFFEPASGNDVSVKLAGAGVEYVSGVYPAFDLLVRADFRTGSRTGLIEFLPEADETVQSVSGHLVGSRFVGPDKISVEFDVARDRIGQEVATAIPRSLEVFATTVRYQIYRSLLGSRPHDRPIAARGSEVFAGWAQSTERFGDIDVEYDDRFIGVALKGLPVGGARSFDITVQPTLFSARNVYRTFGISPFSEHQHIETFITGLYRVVDRENVRDIRDLPVLTALNIVGLYSYNTARTGPPFFNRARLGVQLDAKLVRRRRGSMTWLATAKYELHRFSELRDRHVVGASATLGF
jgi:hypothetical protein